MFAQSCERIKLPDDCTIGFISGEEKIVTVLLVCKRVTLQGRLFVVVKTFSIYVTNLMVNFDFNPRPPTVR